MIVCSVSVSMVGRSWLSWGEVEGRSEVPESVVSDNIQSFWLLSMDWLVWDFLNGFMRRKEFKSANMGMMGE